MNSRMKSHQTKQTLLIYTLLSLSGLLGFTKATGQIYLMPESAHSAWTSSENPNGMKGFGAKENMGAKGHAFDKIAAHDSINLLNYEGAGAVKRITITVDNRTDTMLRLLRIAMYWDGAERPAVSAPLGDFFGAGLGQTVAFESALFSNPEGRSFNCFIPMPFKKEARITIYNDADIDLGHIFYSVSFEKWKQAPADLLYFHSYWHEEKPPAGTDFEILPNLNGQGKFLGSSISVIGDSSYGNLWWGEGEVKMFLDGDDKYPSLVGTGIEDYIGTAWGMGKFINREQGCLLADAEKKHWSFYRYHLSDPVYFHKDIRIAMQQIGGGPLSEVRKAKFKGAVMDAVSVDQQINFIKLKEIKNPAELMDKNFPQGWVNFYRSDTYSASAYFYLDQPTNNLPKIAAGKERVKGLSNKK